MASREIEIDTSMLASDISELQTQLNLAQKEAADVFEKMQELDSMWDGPANETFMEQFANDSEFITGVCNTVQSLIECMEYAQNQYDSCDSEVGALVASI